MEIEKSNNQLLYEYLETHDPKIKQKVIIKYSYIAKTIALQMRESYKACAEVEDIINEGIIALIAAIDKFDKEKNVKFESYASLRIRGAVIDYVRKQYFAPRRVSKLAKDIDNAQAELYKVNNRHATDEEMAEYLNMTLPQYRKALYETSTVSLLSFDELIYENNVSLQNSVVKNIDYLPEANLQQKELLQTLEHSIKKLTEKEQIVLSLYYKNDLSIKDIANVMSVSVPRISQIHSSALRKLKVTMTNYITN